ncbi:MAG: hypothetical protein ABS81_09470 [Pseudonocardia sp. SCN 72-86]|nr:MAG: hypothetical protein ABS81_09470 [Pseudonocardia sp. SCN 72-86]
MQQLGRQGAGTIDGLRPQPLDRVPGRPETGDVDRAHGGAQRVPSVELGLDQRPHVDAVDREALDPAVDLDLTDPRAPHPHAPQLGPVDPQVREPDVGRDRPVDAESVLVGRSSRHPGAARPNAQDLRSGRERQ